MRTPILLSLILSLGCGEPEALDAGPPDAGADAGPSVRCDAPLDAGQRARGFSRGCALALVSSGFAIRTRQAVPLTRWGAFLRAESPDTCPAGSGLSAATLITDTDPRSDEATARVTYHVVGEGEPPGGPDAGAPGWAGLRVVRGSVAVDLDPMSPRASALVLLDLALAGLDGAPTIAVVLDGFEVDTDVPQGPGFPDYDPADGYALSALGVDVGAPTRDGIDLRFEASAHLELGRSGVPEVDRAASVARTRVRVRYAVVGLASPPIEGTVSYGSECRPEDDVAALMISGTPGSHAIPALRSFELGVDGDGTLVRELAVMIDAFQHDPVTGTTSMRVEGLLEGADLTPLATRFDAEVVLLEWAAGGEVASLRYFDTVAEGRAETMLPITP